MSTIIVELYDALKDAGASEEKARAAAKAIADYVLLTIKPFFAQHDTCRDFAAQR